jgi:hypothetical protein
MSLRILAIADSPIARYRERWDHNGIQAVVVPYDSALDFINSPATAETIFDAVVICCTALAEEDWESSSDGTPEMALSLAEQIRSLPHETAMFDGRKWVTIPVILIRLTLIADEASRGIGVTWNNTAKRGKVKNSQFLSIAGKVLADKNNESYCWDVPTEALCVVGKQHTPMKGATFRSLSHHLALYHPSEVSAASATNAQLGQVVPPSEPSDSLKGSSGTKSPFSLKRARTRFGLRPGPGRETLGPRRRHSAID